SSTDYAARRVAARWGFDADRDWQLLELRDQPGILAGLEGGALDAGLLGSPTQQMAQRTAYPNLLSLADQDWEFGLGTITALRVALLAPACAAPAPPAAPSAAVSGASASTAATAAPAPAAATDRPERSTLNVAVAATGSSYLPLQVAIEGGYMRQHGLTEV